MKKLYFIFLLPLIFCGCKKKATPTVSSIYHTVYPTDWLAGSSGNWYVDITDPAITQDVFDNGSVQCYMVFNQGQSNEYLEALPFSFEATGHTYVDFFNAGYAQIQFTDGNTNYPQLPTETYKVVVISEK